MFKKYDFKFAAEVGFAVIVVGATYVAQYFADVQPSEIDDYGKFAVLGAAGLARAVGAVLVTYAVPFLKDLVSTE